MPRPGVEEVDVVVRVEVRRVLVLVEAGAGRHGLAWLRSAWLGLANSLGLEFLPTYTRVNQINEMTIANQAQEDTRPPEADQIIPTRARRV